MEIYKILEKLNIKHNREKKFKNCKDKRELPFDFYLPDNNTCIEYDGKQHFEKTYHWSHDKLSYTQKHDKIKNDFCKKNDIKLLRISYKVNFSDIEIIIIQFLKS